VAVYGTSEREHPVKKTLWFAATALAVALTGWGVGLAVTEPASGTPDEEHAGQLTEDCTGVTGLFHSFPQGVNEVTFTLDGVESDWEFDGPAGSVFVPWDVTDGAVHSAGVAWSADGGGTVPVQYFDAAGCAPPTTTEPPGPPPCFDPYTPGVPGCPTIPPTTTEPPQVTPTTVFDDGDPECQGGWCGPVRTDGWTAG
jgi:hypothetical protein